MTEKKIKKEFLQKSSLLHSDLSGLKQDEVTSDLVK